MRLKERIGWNLAQSAAFQVGQFEILEHDLDQFIQRDVGLVIIDSGAVAGLAVAFALAVLAGLAHDLAGAGVALALAGAGRVVAIDKTVFLDPAEWNLDHAIAVFADDRFFRDDVGDIFADRLADFLAMTRAIACRAVGVFRVGAAVFAKDAFEDHFPITAVPPPRLINIRRVARSGVTSSHGSPMDRDAAWVRALDVVRPNRECR